MLLNGTWRQHKTPISNTAHTGNTRALDTNAVDRGVRVHMVNGRRANQGLSFIVVKTFIASKFNFVFVYFVAKVK